MTNMTYAATVCGGLCVCICLFPRDLCVHLGDRVACVCSGACLGVSLQETGEWGCGLEAVSRARAVRHVDSAHLITQPCVCIVMADNGARGWGTPTGNVKVTGFQG